MATSDEILQKLDIIIELLSKTPRAQTPARAREQKKIENVKLARAPIPWQNGSGMFLRIEMQTESGESYFPSVGARNNAFETGEEPLTWQKGDVISFAGKESRDENGKTVYWADAVKRVAKAEPREQSTPEDASSQAMEAGATPPEIRKPDGSDADEDVPF